ncbi:MAG: leucine-rich repeat protein, partial [Oscillospiraceae bacterium]|nr:leucine-rich repeat protein [Oscillospiraceae bacterium]
EFTMTENLKSVGSHAFDGCTNLTALTFADSASTKFEDEVFKNCKALTEIALPAWLDTVPVGMFSGCRDLTEVTLSEGVSHLGGMAFADTGLTSVTLPESCLYVDDAAFQNAPIGSVKLGSETVSIGADAFVQDTNLHLMPSVYVPDSVKAIGERAFGYYKDTDKNYEDLCAEAERREAETGEHVDVQSLMAPTIANHDFILYGGTEAKRYAEENDMIYGGTDPTVEPEQPAVVTGELNGDGTVNASDAAVILIAAAAMGAGSGSGLTAAQLEAADVNKDGTVNASDAAIVLIYAAAAGAGQDVKLTDFVKK